MYYVVKAECYDYEDVEVHLLGVTTDKVEAEQAIEHLKAVRDKVYEKFAGMHGMVIGCIKDLAYGDVEPRPKRKFIETDEYYQSYLDAFEEARPEWEAIKSILGDLPYWLVSSQYDYDIEEVPAIEGGRIKVG